MKFNWGHGILIFILLFLAVITAFVVFALFQSQDLVSEDYYDKGAGYSNQVAINQRSEIYRDSIKIIIEDGEIYVKLSKTLAASGDTLRMYFYRPSDKKQDFSMNCQMSHLVSLPADRFRPGHYEVKLSWSHRDEIFNVNKDLSIK